MSASSPMSNQVVSPEASSTDPTRTVELASPALGYRTAVSSGYSGRSSTSQYVRTGLWSNRQ